MTKNELLDTVTAIIAYSKEESIAYVIDELIEMLSELRKNIDD